MGDFTQKYSEDKDTTKNSFIASSTHKVVLSGDGLQTVCFDNPNVSKFNILELENRSKDGIVFDSSVSVNRLITNESNISAICVNTVNWTLEEDVVIKNSLELASGIINLNGHKLIVEGDLLQSAWVIEVAGGMLDVAGDYTISGKASEYLSMQNEKDYVKVGGNFTTSSSINHETYLTAGTMEIKGDMPESKESDTPHKNFTSSKVDPSYLSRVDQKETIQLRKPIRFYKPLGK